MDFRFKKIEGQISTLLEITGRPDSVTIQLLQEFEFPAKIFLQITL